ncbi:glycosyltransferase family 92 protein, partial [Tanacetum coccineum]
SSISTQFDDDHDAVNSPLNIRVHEAVNPLIITPEFDNGDVNSSNFTTGFDNDDVTTSTTSSIKFDDVNSPLSTQTDIDDVTYSVSTKFDEHDVNSSNFTTGFDNDDVKSPLTLGNSSVGNDFENDDVTSTQFEDDDHDAVNSLLNNPEFDNGYVNSPLVDVNSSVSTNSDNDDVTTSITTTQIHEVNSGTDDVTSSTISTEFDNDDVNSALITQFDGHNVNLPLTTEPDDGITVSSPIIDANSPVSSQFDDNDDVTVGSPIIDANSPVSSQFDDNDDVTVIANVNVSVLFPAWEALVIVKSDDIEKNNKSMSFYCLFDTNEVTKAKFAGTLSFSRETYTCRLPTRFRRRLPFRQPVLTHSKDDVWVTSASSPELLRWNYIVYDVIDNEKDENDVVLLAKGINNRQGVNRSPKEFRCLFGDDLGKGVLTEVSSSLQEVFRCKRPDLSHLTAFSQTVVKASLVIVESNYHVVPSVAYYEPRHSKVVKEGGNGKKLLCACTMVYNVAKFLKEWVIYHANIGVDKFVLYDNGSDDDLDEVVKVLKSRGYDVEVRFWLWPKTQEAGYSHAAFVDKDSCKWMMYIDVDEFVYSPKWKSLKPSKGLLPSFLPSSPYGQVIIKCYEFGPSGQKKHPLTGVTQGYNCRKEVENRHKSIVLLDAVHKSLLNMIHHFKLKDGYKSMKVELESVAVNHYKYQAWVEFKAKFRGRVSAYVVDWTRSVNLKSNDRAPGLGYSAVKPDGWEDRFCEVHDNRLRDLT